MTTSDRMMKIGMFTEVFQSTEIKIQKMKMKMEKLS